MDNTFVVSVFEQYCIVSNEPGCQVEIKDQAPLFRQMLRQIPKFVAEWSNSKQQQDYFRSLMMNADNVRFVYMRFGVLFLLPTWFTAKYKHFFKGPTSP